MALNLQQVITTIIVLRISQLFIDYNFDRADEYWQGSQVAYKIYYGYGYLSWQWTMAQPIRSPLYQLYLSLGYYLCQHTHCTSYLREIAPKIMQLGLSVLCDLFLIKTASYYVKNISYLVSILLLTNWYYFSMLNRIYINSAETCLATIAFYYWATRQERKINDYISRALVVINFSLRPTSLFIWAIIWPYELFTKKDGKIIFIIKNAIQIIVICLFSMAVGTIWYGQFTWIDFNFFKYNVFLKFSELYGVNSFLQYFYATIPLIMASYLIPFLISIKQHLPFLKRFLRNKKEKDQQEDIKEGKVQILQVWESKRYWELFLLSFIILLFLSLSSHKQSRFLLILTPFLLILSIKGFQKLTDHKIILLIVIAINIFIFTTLTLSTKTGGTQIIRDLRQQIDKFPVQKHRNITVMYLCEPHSLPYLTVLQRHIDLRLIDTSPFKKLENFNEQVQLINNPYGLYQQMSQGKDPQFIIIQQKYATKGAHLNQKYAFLIEKGYTLISSKRNINSFQLQFIGWDGFTLLKKV